LLLSSVCTSKLDTSNALAMAVAVDDCADTKSVVDAGIMDELPCTTGICIPCIPVMAQNGLSCADVP